MREMENSIQQFSYSVIGPEHAKVWRALRVEGARDFPLGFMTTMQETLAVPLDRCRSTLKRGNIRGIFFNKKLVGFCRYRHGRLIRTQHRGEIGAFFVTPNFHGTGAASALMAGVAKEAKANGVSRLELFVDTENHRAIAFCEKEGFECVATHGDGVRIGGRSRLSYAFVRRL